MPALQGIREREVLLTQGLLTLRVIMIIGNWIISQVVIKGEGGGPLGSDHGK